MSDTKFCPYCNKILPIQAFMARTGAAYGYCRPCMTLYQRARTYGNLDKKPLQCGICGVIFLTGVKPVVDHSHVTGRFRDFLCGNCNKGLGFFKDSIEKLQKAIEYLTKHNATPIESDTVELEIIPEEEDLTDKTLLELHELNKCGGIENKCRFHLIDVGLEF